MYLRTRQHNRMKRTQELRSDYVEEVNNMERFEKLENIND